MNPWTDDEIRLAKFRVTSIMKDRQIPPIKAIEDLSKCIEILSWKEHAFTLAQAYAIRGTAFARGFENHEAAFFDWKQALSILKSRRSPSSKYLSLAGWIRTQMAFHSEGDSCIHHYNQALSDYRRAKNPRGVAFVIVHRGLEWKKSGQYSKALDDLKTGLAIAREKNMRARRQLIGFIQETEIMMKEENLNKC